MKRFLWLAMVLELGSLPVLAGRWQCELPGGAYVVDTTKIASVSTHEYLVDGAARVTELTIATDSGVTARFYYLEPVAGGPGGRAQELLNRIEERAGMVTERAGTDQVWRKVVKSYPTTTHAHTVEYRLEDKAQIQKIFNSVMDAWRNNKDLSLKIAAATAE
jgi:hypothetical protein